MAASNTKHDADYKYLFTASRLSKQFSGSRNFICFSPYSLLLYWMRWNHSRRSDITVLSRPVATMRTTVCSDHDNAIRTRHVRRIFSRL